METPYNIGNFAELPLKIRTYLTKEWAKRDRPDLRGPGRPPQYPWDEWMDGKTHTALAGRDFHQSRDRFKHTLQQKAYHAGMKVGIQTYEVPENGPTGPVQFWINFWFVPKNPPVEKVRPSSTLDDLPDDDPRKRLDLSILTRPFEGPVEPEA